MEGLNFMPRTHVNGLSLQTCLLPGYFLNNFGNDSHICQIFEGKVWLQFLLTFSLGMGIKHAFMFQSAFLINIFQHILTYGSVAYFVKCLNQVAESV